MEEKIYTIPVNEAFDKKCGCPFCTLFSELEQTELESILGAAMMEPDTRIETNKKGFCKKHFSRMFGMKNRLGLGLMLESHLAEISKKVSAKPALLVKDAGLRAADFVDSLTKSCYLCDKIDDKLGKMFKTAAFLWEKDKAFRDKLREQPYFCLPHYAMFLRTASGEIPKKLYGDFLKEISELETSYLETLTGDVSWFCKKFDYRYDSEPWGNSKDSVERSIDFLAGKD